MSDDVYDRITSDDYKEFFQDYSNEVRKISEDKISALTMEEASNYYGLERKNARKSFIGNRNNNK
jgi:hypothetical protein